MHTANRKIVNFSPRTYFRTILYDKVELVRGKKRKTVSSDSFIIPDFADYKSILILNYNVRQLKQMCRFYKQKISGNKPQLINRMYNYLKYSHHTTTLQKNVRGWIRRHYLHTGGLLKNRTKIVNETDFLTLEPMKELPYFQFFSYKDSDGFIYGFNIKSLYNLMVNSKGNMRNPYTRRDFPKDIVKNIRIFIRLSRILGEPIEINLKNDTQYLSQQKRLELKTLSIFYRIDSFGHITDAKWFLGLDRQKLIRYIKELQDIWNYRATLTPEKKKNICPPTGDPFHGININSLIQKNSETLQRNILYVMENLISKSGDKDNQALGAFYILAALTLVSTSAAIALPWLYQSVAQA